MFDCCEMVGGYVVCMMCGEVCVDVLVFVCNVYVDWFDCDFVCWLLLVGMY